MANLEQLTLMLHRHGLKSTPLRIELLKMFGKHADPMTAEQIQKGLKEISYDQATLFRGLKKFSEVGLIQVIDLGEGFLRYEGKCDHHEHHHHIMCKECKKIEVIPFCIPAGIEKYLNNAGYSDISHRMDFFGVCSSCR